MTPTTISLNGSDWKVLPLMPREWEWRRVWEQGDQLMPSLWIPAQVPGCVQDDAQEAGLIPDYAVDFNSRACEWTSERDWVYCREFTTPEGIQTTARRLKPAATTAVPSQAEPSASQGAVARLRFEGVDYACHVYLNGEHLGDHEGMYDAFEFDVTGLLVSEGLNRLVVVVEHAPREVGQIGRTSEVRIWKARFAYNWDWCTRLIPIGIHDSVSLVVTGAAFIRDVQVTTRLHEDFSVADVGVSVDIGAVQATGVQVSVAVAPEGERAVVEASGTVLATGESTGWSHLMRVAHPNLWWSGDYGEQALYEARVELRDEDGRLLDSRTVTFGIRRVRALQNDNAPEDALPYVLEVNGKRIFIKGWNWAPIRQLYGREMPDRYERWLRMARHAHCNFLRIWGGGLLEKPVFYELCDRLGIMVWQEFIQSSSGIDNRPSTSPEYLAYIRDQAEKMIPRRRNHPSLVLWCGGNELMHDNWTPLDDTHPALAVLKDCVRRLDPDRLWLPTSGSGPVENASLEHVGRMHDVHGPWQYQGPEEHYRLYNGIDPLLHAEFGVEGAANLSSMRRANTESLLWPPDETNPLWMHRGSWWIQRAMMTRVFGEIGDLETYVRASQLLQAEGLRYCYESNRRRKWHCAGAIPWQYNESWPNLSCTNVMDYFGQPRPAYWWCRKALEPFHVSAKYDKLGWNGEEAFRAEVWLNNSLEDAERTEVTWEALDVRGRVLGSGSWEIRAPGGAALRVGEVASPLAGVPEGLFILRLRARATDGRSSANDYLFSTAPEPVLGPVLAAPEATLEVTKEGEAVRLRNSGEVFALGVHLEPAGDDWLEFSDNYLVLAPGEGAEILCSPAGSAVKVSAVNVAELRAG